MTLNPISEISALKKSINDSNMSLNMCLADMPTTKREMIY